jgi:hypothetical protein
MNRIILLLFVCIAHSAMADCVSTEDGKIIKVTVKQCKKISPLEEPSIKSTAGAEWYDTWKLERLYSGALITDISGTSWVYPSGSKTPCMDFKPGAVVEKKAYYTCCDTGNWGKCVFGGKFLTDVNGSTINTFQ